MKKITSSFIFFTLIFGIGLMSNQGCKKDEQSSPRDKFISGYDGTLECEGLLSLIINGMTTFNIDESSKGIDYVDITINSNPVLRLEATVSGNSLTVNTEIPGVTIENFGTVDIKATGVLTISQNETVITGPLSINLKNESNDISDTCIIMGSKK